MDNLYSKLKTFLALWEAVRKTPRFTGEDAVNFERKLAERIGIKHVVTVASGTDALILSLKALGIGPGDEVIVPALGVFATASAISWVNAKPVFVDVEEESMNIDPAKISKVLTFRTKAIIPVHLNGRMANMEAIAEIAKHKSLKIIEDAAHALGASYRKYPPGHFGDVACLSFNPTKILSGYDNGGAILTNNDAIAEKLFWMRRYGSRFAELGIDHPVVGVASVLGRLQAASLGLNLDAFDRILGKTKENYFLYLKLLADARYLKLSANPPPKYTINGYRFIIRTAQRDELRKLLQGKGVDARFQYGIPLPYLGAFKHLGHKKGDFPVAERIASECLALPTRYSLSSAKITQIANLVKQFLG